MQTAKTFSEGLASGRTLLADGATGTMLQAAGLPVCEPPERWTRDRPEAIRDLAQARQPVQLVRQVPQGIGAQGEVLEGLQAGERVAVSLEKEGIKAGAYVKPEEAKP